METEEYLRFITTKEIILQKEKNLFEILENFDHESSYFKSKCLEYGKEIVINARDKRVEYQGRTLLHHAASLGLINAVTFLVKYGCNVNAFDSSVSRTTPLMESISMMHLEVSVFLSRNGADLFIQDINGENALHYCARTNSKTLTQGIIGGSSLSISQIQECASVSNIKQKFPEDLAKSFLCQEALREYREKGYLSRKGNNKFKENKNFS